MKKLIHALLNRIYLRILLNKYAKPKTQPSEENENAT